MSTIKDIAKACNVSVATVSNVINDKPNVGDAIRARVLQALTDMDYRPNYVAKNLKTSSTQTIGILVEDITVFSIPEIIEGVTQCSEKHDYHIILNNLSLHNKYEDTYYYGEEYFDTVQKEIRELLAKQVDGIIYIASHERIIQCIPEDLLVPVIMTYGYSKSEKCPSVVVDEVRGTYELIEYLMKLGHEKIGVISGKDGNIHTSARMVGYQKALYDNNMFYNPDLVVSGEWTREGGYSCVDTLLANDVTAIFCMNDLMAGGVYDRLAERSIIPGKDISIIGYDDRELASYLRPRLTTMKLPLYNIGYTSCELLLDMIRMKHNDEYINQSEVVVIEEKGELIIRESTCAI
ncbi:MAG: LacI family DNA-binding transcriptional regulator [Clostridiales Family XIII bacterium]|jgi:LacI family transcriptional regulator|nr:LacI family DNA-binding transcriptional regulator [Clostridiales Family XIII bacterium]